MIKTVRRDRFSRMKVAFSLSSLCIHEAWNTKWGGNVLRKLFAALALMLAFNVSIAQADRVLYAAQGTLTPERAREAAALLEEALGEPFALVMQEETGESLERLAMEGSAPALAVVPVQEALPWAREGMLLALDGCVEGFGRVAGALADACVVEERLIAAPLFAVHRQVAVRADLMQEAMMGYLLDRRAHPVWYPSEFVQALDELAMLSEAGLDVWPPEAGEMLYLEALLQGVTGMRLADGETGAYAADAEGLSDALEWLEDMLHAGLIGAAEDRETALERFLCGETAIFPDWTAEETAAHADAIQEESILLIPYPSLHGSPLRAAELVVLCAFSSGEEEENALLERAVRVICGAEHTSRIFKKREILDDGAQWLPLLETLAYGPTLRALFGRAAGDVIAQEAKAGEAARQVDRAMRTMGW